MLKNFLLLLLPLAASGLHSGFAQTLVLPLD